MNILKNRLKTLVSEKLTTGAGAAIENRIALKKIKNSDPLILLCVLVSFSLSACDDNEKKANEYPASEVSLQDVSAQVAISYDDRMIEEALSELIGVRYQKNVPEDKMDFLRKAWRFDPLIENKWNEKILNDFRVRIFLAELLHEGEDSEYRIYILSKLSSDNEAERSSAALSLGYVGHKDDVEVLANMLLSDDIFPAAQAGMGLLAMNTSYALQALVDTLKSLKNRNDKASVHLYKVITSQLFHLHPEYKGYLEGSNGVVD
jgi:hypothetical protein